MNQFQKTLLGITALTLFSCGGSNPSSSTKSPFKGVTDLLSQITEKSEILKGDGGKSPTKEQTDEYFAFADSKIAEAKEEAAKMIGNKVPFSGDPFLLLEVADVVISDARMQSLDCEVDVKVMCKPKKEITLTAQQNDGSMDKFISDGESLSDATCSIYAMQYALFIDNSDNVIDYKKFKPFVSNKYDFKYKDGDKITPSQYCNDNGSVFHIQISRGNFADFKEIRFVTEAELQNVINNSKQ